MSPTAGYRLTIFALMLSIGSVSLLAQVRPQRQQPAAEPDRPATTGQDSTFVKKRPQRPSQRDTSKTMWYLMENWAEKFPQADTSLTMVQQYDFARRARSEVDHLTLGNFGSAALPAFYRRPFQRGVDIGLHQFDLYHIGSEEFRFFDSKRGFAKAAYTAGGEQEDGALQVDFGKNFERGINFSINHHRIFQTGEANHFNHQKAKHSAAGFGLSYTPDASAYGALLVYTANVSDQEDNGGLSKELAGIDRPFEEPVVTQTANTKHRHRELAFRQFLQLRSRPDSTGQRERRSYSLQHTMRYQISDFKFRDTRLPTDTLIDLYAGYPADDRGLRNLWQREWWETGVFVQTFRPRKLRTAGNVNLHDFLQFGALYSNHRIYQEPVTSTRHNLFLTGKWTFDPGKLLKIKAYAHLGLLDRHSGDYRVQGDVQLQLAKWGQLQATFVQQLNEPTELQSQFWAMQEQVWQHDFQKTLETQIAGRLNLPKLQTELGFSYQLLNNLVYFDTLSYPVQTGLPVSILQATLRKDVRVWRIHLDNLLAVQQVSEDFLQLPEFFSKHSLYFDGMVIKKQLGLQLGIDVRMYSRYAPLTYQPLTGQFHRQERVTLPLYPQVDVFANIKVGSFRGFFKFESVASWLGLDFLQEQFGQRYFYQLARHPYPNATVRWGISWVFME